MANQSAAFRALSDPTRRRVFERLRRAPMPVGRIARGLDVSRPAVSQHLKVLLDAHLVTVRQVGTRREYGVDQRGIEAMRRYLDAFWDGALAAFKQAAESEERA